MRWVLGVLSAALVGWSVALAWSVVRHAIEGSKVAQWSDIPIVWLGELVLAAASGALGLAVAVSAVRRIRRGSAASLELMPWIGLGFIAVGILGFVAGLLGFHVPTAAGHDPLERIEAVLILVGVAAGALGAVLAVVSGIAVALRAPHAPRGPAW